MKKLFPALFVLFVILIAFFSCEKGSDSPPKTELTKAEMLVQKTWQVEEVLRNISGVNSHYIKGGVNTTGTDYAQIRLTFKADGTGTYNDEASIVHTTTWEFTSADQRNMILKISAPSGADFIWNLVEISESSFTNVTAFGESVLVAARYTPFIPAP